VNAFPLWRPRRDGEIGNSKILAQDFSGGGLSANESDLVRGDIGKLPGGRFPKNNPITEWIVMKAFGIRLAFGAVTILCGAYAAAVAQKDNPNEAGDPWSAPVPSLVAEPIEGNSLAKQAASAFSGFGLPSSDTQAAKPPQTVEQADYDPWASKPGKVELTQHSEPADAPSMASGFSLPPSLGAPNEGNEASKIPAPSSDNDAPSDAMEVPIPDWMNEAAEPAPNESIAAPLEPMPMPEKTAAVQSLAAIPENANPASNLRPNDLRGEIAPAYGPSDIAQPSIALEEPAAQLPAMQAPPAMQAAPSMQTPPAMQASPTRAAEVTPQLPPPNRANAAASPMLPAPGAQPFADGASLGGFAAPIPARPIASAIQPAGVGASSNIEVDPQQVQAAPGDRRLDGLQSPSLTIQKRAPQEVKIGKAAPFVIQVQNVGPVEALDVKVHDRIPQGMRLVDASPAPVQQGDLLLWTLGAMPSGDERTITMQLVAEAEGELGSVARVTFESAASCRTISTRPELKIVQHAPTQVLVGQQLEIELEVSNPGTGEATNVILQEDVPDGLVHPKGRQLDNLIGNLAPGEIRRQMLRMQAVEPGIVQNLIRLVSDDGLTAEHMVNIEVIAPKLNVAVNGPARRFLERQANYQVDIANAGTADATNVEIVVQLDRGFTFVSTGNHGIYDPSRHAVTWSLPSLPAGAAGSVPLTLLPVEQGARILKIEARSDLNATASNEHEVMVETFAQLDFQFTNPGGPIEVGSDTSYEVHVSNSGSANDGNIQVQLMLPPGLELVSSESDSQSDGRGGVVFAPRAQLAPGADFLHRIQVRATAPGTHIVKAIVISDQQKVAVTKEVSTLVYADQ
jgi:uncharacterized repeat protein (TIGR01451 family)